MVEALALLDGGGGVGIGVRLERQSLFADHSQEGRVVLVGQGMEGSDEDVLSVVMTQLLVVCQITEAGN